MKRIVPGIDWFPPFHEGDRKAFEHLFELYYPPVLCYANRLLRQDPEAKDIVMRTFTLAWEKKHEFESLEHLRRFLYIVTRNACHSRLRALVPEKKALKELIYLAQKQEEGPDLEQVRSEIVAVLRERIAGLPEDQQKVIDLSFYRNMSISAIAAELGINYEAVATRKCRAIATLRSSLKQSWPSGKKRSCFL